VERSVELFVDASRGSLTALDVSRLWTRFFEVYRGNLKRVTFLASSKGVALTMAIVRHLSNTGDLIRIHSERELYEARKAASG
jgi:hypothetical protein